MKAIQIEAFGKPTEVVKVVDPGLALGIGPRRQRVGVSHEQMIPNIDLPRVEAVMDKQVRFETSGALGILTLANPP